MQFLFVLSIFIAIWFGSVIIIRACHGRSISWLTFALFAAALTAVITKSIGMW